MLLFVIRHGDPIYDPDSLTPLGRLQAQALAKRFAVHGLDRVFSSPVIRAQQTAEPTCEMLKLSKEIEEWTSESLAWQDLTVQDPETGKTRWIFSQHNASFRSGGDQLLGNANWQKAGSLNGLDADHCLDRIRRESDRFLERLGYRREEGVYRILRPSEERVALFCHQGFSMGWFPHLLNIPPHLFWSAFDVNHSGVTLFEFKNYANNITAPKCLCFSDVSHFLKEGLPLRFSNGVRM